LEGHLNVHTTVDNGVITDARCVGAMFRGFEIILQGRHPMDAQQVTQRICGVCPYAHAIASSYAQENAFALQVPPNGRILHNLIQGANHLYDYLLHFYQLSALDFVDITAILDYQGSDHELNTLKNWVQAELQSERSFPVAPFLPRLSGAYLAETDINIGAIKHYLDAMEIQKKANRASAIFGGKFPHATAIFPGGCSQNATIDHIATYQDLILEVRTFYEETYLQDLLAVAQAFPEYWEIGASKGGFLSYGLLPLNQEPNSRRLLEGGVLVGERVEEVDFGAIHEDITHSWYTKDSGGAVRESLLAPEPRKANAYSWVKAPRYRDMVVEVGPAARVLVDYFQRNNRKITELVDTFTTAAGIEPLQLNSVLGRHLCRGISGLVIADFLLEQSERINHGEPAMAEIDIPQTGEGFGATEASRGALLHYIRLR
jgi:ferredoxin hydrogenase large subunit/hydrogenase large subunit